MKKTKAGFTQVPLGDLSSSPLVGEVARSADGGLSNRKTFFNTLLPRLTAVLPPQGREITANGFTLIELLVVVLIIGILAAVAVPQYQKAVRKARIAEARVLLKSLINATDVFLLENPGYDEIPSIENLNIDVPADTKNWTIYIDDCTTGGGTTGKRGCVAAAEPKWESGYSIFYCSANAEGGEGELPGKFVCLDEGTNICKGLGSPLADGDGYEI